jgi:hypothetical protein
LLLSAFFLFSQDILINMHFIFLREVVDMTLGADSKSI